MHFQLPADGIIALNDNQQTVHLAVIHWSWPTLLCSLFSSDSTVQDDHFCGKSGIPRNLTALGELPGFDQKSCAKCLWENAVRV